jgi:beta-galactosidase
MRFLALLLMATTLATSLVQAEKPAFQPPATPSLKLNFNPGWQLAKGSFPFEGTDDSQWERVSTPHTYHEKFGYQGLKKGIKDLGPHTYRKHFTVPKDYEGRRLILEFEGIRQRGQFYLNGHLLGRSSHGVSPLGFDITPHVKFGGENILHVEIDCDDKEFETGTPMCWFFPDSIRSTAVSSAMSSCMSFPRFTQPSRSTPS